MSAAAAVQEFQRLDVGYLGLPAHGRSDGAELAVDLVVLRWIVRFAFTTTPRLAAGWSARAGKSTAVTVGGVDDQ